MVMYHQMFRIAKKTFLIGGPIGGFSVYLHERSCLKKKDFARLWIQNSSIFDFYNRNNWICVENIPRKYQTQEMWNEYVKDFSRDRFKKVPFEFETQEMWDKYAQRYSFQIQSIPEKFITQKVCDQYAKDHPDRISNIPKKYQTQQMWNKYIDLCPFWRSIGDVPEKFRTKKMCIKCADRDPNSFHHIPAKYFTHEMLVRYVSANTNLIKLVPNNFLTQEFYNEIFAFSTRSVQIIPEKFITWDICKKIPIDSGLAKHIPKKYIDQYLDTIASSFFKPHNLKYLDGMQMSGKSFNKYFKSISIKKLTKYDGENYRSPCYTFFNDMRDNDCDNLFTWDVSPWDRLYSCDTNKCLVSNVTVLDNANVTFCKNGITVTHVLLGSRTEYERPN